MRFPMLPSMVRLEEKVLVIFQRMGAVSSSSVASGTSSLPQEPKAISVARARRLVAEVSFLDFMSVRLSGQGGQANFFMAWANKI